METFGFHRPTKSPTILRMFSALILVGIASRSEVTTCSVLYPLRARHLKTGNLKRKSPASMPSFAKTSSPLSVTEFI